MSPFLFIFPFVMQSPEDSSSLPLSPSRSLLLSLYLLAFLFFWTQGGESHTLLPLPHSQCLLTSRPFFNVFLTEDGHPVSSSDFRSGFGPSPASPFPSHAAWTSTQACINSVRNSSAGVSCFIFLLTHNLKFIAFSVS